MKNLGCSEFVFLLPGKWSKVGCRGCCSCLQGLDLFNALLLSVSMAWDFTVMFPLSHMVFLSLNPGLLCQMCIVNMCFIYIYMHIECNVPWVLPLQMLLGFLGFFLIIFCLFFAYNTGTLKIC